MGDTSTPELSRIVNLILDNPKLIEEISKMARSDSNKSDIEEERASEITENSEGVNVSAEYIESVPSSRTDKREMLISALKPYLSESRSRAIDSMVSVAKMLEIIKLR